MSPWQVLRHPGCGLSRRQPTASAVAMGSSRRWYIRPVEMSFDYISVKLFSRLTKKYLWLQCDWTQMWPETNFIVAHNGYKVIEDICTAKWIHSRCMYICLSTCLHKYIYIYIYIRVMLYVVPNVNSWHGSHFTLITNIHHCRFTYTTKCRNTFCWWISRKLPLNRCSAVCGIETAWWLTENGLNTYHGDIYTYIDPWLYQLLTILHRDTRANCIHHHSYAHVSSLKLTYSRDQKYTFV